MAGNALSDQSFYSAPSTLQSGHLHLSPAIKEGAEQPYFRGSFLKPRISALSLLTLSKVVRTRFHTPPAMLQRILRESDPVVTCNGNEVLFEGFSACCSTYCKVDFSPSAFNEPECGNGTTNVDFGAEMRAALAQVRDSHSLDLEVGQNGVTIESNDSQVIEKKIPLPVRWIKSFCAIQSYLAEMKEFAQLTRIEALRLIRSIPRSPSPRATYYMQKAGRSIRFSQVARNGAIELKAIERLLLLEDVIPIADKVIIYATPDCSATCWIIEAESLQFSICISADAWRGFSGEGRGLEGLTKELADHDKSKMMSALLWNKNITVSEFAATWSLTETEATEILNHFAQKGMIGYDLKNAQYFYRRLPYDLKSLDQLQPRLKKAKKLIEQNAVDFENKDSLATASVKDGINCHQVFIDGDTARCTCTWYAKHKNERGFCSHILAVKTLKGSDHD